MRPAYADRQRLKAQILERLSKGRTMTWVGSQPDLPALATIYRWAKADHAFRFQLDEARREGAAIRRLCRDVHGYHPGKADKFLRRVRAGEWVGDLVRTREMPHRAALDRWRRERPEFAQALAEAVRQARPGRLRRAPAYSEDLADKVILALVKGIPLSDLRRAAGLPCEPVLAAWRRAHPEFDGAVRTAIRWGHRARMRTRRGALPHVREKFLKAIFCGDTVHSLMGRPGMPHPGTVYRWMRRDPAFAAEVEWAAENRDFLHGAEPSRRQLRRAREER